jgi:hypothetical protein
MCVEFLEKPYALPLEFEYTRDNLLILTFSLLLGKVTELRRGVHEPVPKFSTRESSPG